MGGLTAALLVGLGGFFGAIARWSIALAVARRFGTTWPWGTFVVNVSGCFAIGFFVTLGSERLVLHESWRLLVPIGFVGAYTTFSTYALEAARLVSEGQWLRAGSYLVASTAVGFAAVVSASWLARRL